MKEIDTVKMAGYRLEMYKNLAKILPVIEIFFLISIYMSSPQPVFSILVALLIPVTGISALKIERKTNILYYKTLFSVKVLVLFLLCWSTGVKGTGWLFGFTVIVTFTYILPTYKTKFGYVALGILAIAGGNYLAGKELSENLTSVLVIFTFAAFFMNSYIFLMRINQKIEDQKAIIKQERRKLERSHKDLEQKYTELQVSSKKLEELDQAKEQFLEKMNILEETYFPSLKEKLETLMNASVIDSKEIIRQALRDMHTIDDTLLPFRSLYLTERAIRSRHVLLAETNKKQQIIAKMALGGTGVELDIVSDIETGQSYLDERNYDIICSDAEMIELTQLAVEKNPSIQSVFMTSEDAPNYLPILNQYPFLSNIVSRNDKDRTFTLKNITTTVSKLITQNYFGLEKYLNWGVDVQQRLVTHSARRIDLIDEMETYFKKLGVRQSLLMKCSMVVEELLMNAIYDAPVDAKGNALYNHLPRTEPIDLKPEEQGVFRYACDGLLLAVSVEDPFGSFHRETILKYLESCYTGRAGTLQDKKGGAGRGLFQIIETSDLVVFNIKPKVRTEIIVIFNIDPNKLKSSQTTSFHYFYG